VKKILILFVFSIAVSLDLNVSSSLKSGYCSSYDFYDYSENLLDVNLFSNNLFFWTQYEYSNPPEIGFPLNDFRKFRIEYSAGGLSLKAGDIYEFWGRGLLLNQFDDQTTNFDNGTRGLALEYMKGPLTISHINGNSSIWLMGQDIRVPGYNNIHSMMANRFQYDWSRLSVGITQLKSNEIHQKQVNIEAPANVNHNLRGAYFSLISNNYDAFFEYVDKVATEKPVVFDVQPNDTLKRGHGIYGNLNFYLGNWALSSEYKRYSFDASHTDLTADDYGNRISFQQMPTLAKEHNDVLLGRLVHNYNYNDERGIQFEINGSVSSLNLLAQYAHLSRNNTWQSISLFEWVPSPISNLLPATDPSALPYFENYFEATGYALKEKLFFKLGFGRTKEVLKTNRYFEGNQRDINSIFILDTTYNEFDVYQDFPIIDTLEMFDTTESYIVESKMWQVSKAMTLPMEFQFSLNNGYNIGIGFQYQERKYYDRIVGNSSGYSTSDSSWVMLFDDTGEEIEKNETKSKLVNRNGDIVQTQFNRVIYLQISKAPKWSITVTQDFTNAYEGAIPVDPYYNPLEALISGDLKYFLGSRNTVKPPSWIKNRWLSAEVSYNITPAQRISVMYGSIQGGLFCSNGICRVIPAFNDGVKLSYSASF
tara:strand:+ start:419 stop:2365 length:1947 start_codon:yes stop_codon:yes gene_type:complete